ncbi:MAG: hypothetical protein RMX96_32680 [Nostoc sp. ChiSLP02]|nr:hypothetical protein [Nostoc sp. DedSLP05]MDZ8100579.1 hypothetical protein [Nostoc sp. DedSLP01]MDZ8189581.1 hypothetical protein [Nostoc sp. ChiSLP02]
MPGGNASHKGSSDKPNVNASGQINGSAADKSTDPDDVLLEGITTNTTRTQEFVDFPPALERPNQKPDTEDTEKDSQ